MGAAIEPTELMAIAMAAANGFLDAHPGELERDDLIQEGCLAVLRWSWANDKALSDRKHALALMRSAMFSRHLRHLHDTTGLSWGTLRR